MVDNGNLKEGDSFGFFGTVIRDPETKKVKEIVVLPEDIPEIIPPTKTLAHILVDIGIFPSLTQARKNGFDKIPEGYSDRYYGKFKIRITILNPKPSSE